MPVSGKAVFKLLIFLHKKQEVSPFTLTASFAPAYFMWHLVLWIYPANINL